MGQFEAKDLRAIGFSALLAVGLYLTSWVVPLLGGLISLWSPVPLILLYYRRGLTAGRAGTLLASLMALGAFLAFFNTFAGGLYFLYYAVIAAVLCEAPVFGLAFDKSVAAASFAGLMIVLGFVAYAGILSPEGFAVFKQMHLAELDSLLEPYRQGFADPGKFAAVRRYFLEVSRTILDLFPGLLTVGTLLITWLNALLAHRLLSRKSKAEKRYSSSLADWRAPEKLVWVLIAAAALMVFGQGLLFWLGANVLLVSGFVYFLQGLAILAHLFQRKNTPRFIRIWVYFIVGVFVVFQPFLAVVAAAAGLFDFWFDFRKLKSPPTQ